MADRKTTSTRRDFMKAGLAVAMLLPVVVAPGTRAANATKLPRLSETEPTAKALGYVHDAGRIDASVRGGPDRICASCRFYTDTSAEDWGPCTLFPGKDVKANGWCRGWVARET